MLKIDFHESGTGETILLTFPSGGMGVIDAHPSQLANRPDILNLIGDRPLHFVCLTHPHRDHGADLIPLLQKHLSVKQFWYTVDDVQFTVFLQQEAMNYPNYPSACREAVVRMKKGWANFLVDLYGTVAERGIPHHRLRSDERPLLIDDVEISVLSPDEAISEIFVKEHNRRLRDFKARQPNINLLSAILAVKYAGVVVLLGADAVKENWRSATRLYREYKLPKALIIKVPHHGAKDALQVQRGRHEHNYLDLCSRDPRCASVLFAGDARHPDQTVFNHLVRHTETMCVSNGLKAGNQSANPLKIGIPGARAAALPAVCNPIVSFTISPEGQVNRTAGECNKPCPAYRA